MKKYDVGVGAIPDAVCRPFPQTGFVRLPEILAPRGPIPIARSTWWAGVKEGRYPKPVKLGRRITAWRAQDINELIDKAE